MDKLKYIFLAAVVSVFPIAGVAYYHPDHSQADALPVDSVTLAWHDSTALHLQFTVLAGQELKSDYRVIATPVLQGDSGAVYFETIEFAGKRNKKYNDRMAHFEKAARNVVYTPGDTVVWDTLLTVEPWMRHEVLDLTIARLHEGCCRADSLADEKKGSTKYIPPFIPVEVEIIPELSVAEVIAQHEPSLKHISEYKPYDKNIPLRKMKDALYVHFPQNKYVINPDYRANRETMDKIVDMIGRIEQDTNSQIVKIVVIGVASPEGAVALNDRVAYRRAMAMKDFITKYTTLQTAEYEIVNAGEAWADMKDMLEETITAELPARDEFLAIIAENDDLTVREQKMRALQGGKPFEQLRRMFADQRNAGYLQFYYEVAADPVVNGINDAVRLVREERYAEALELLNTLPDDVRKYNTLAVAYYMKGDKEQALEYFTKAADQGDEDARKNVEQIENIKKATEMK